MAKDVSDATTPATIKMLADAEISSTLKVDNGNNITLDLNGCMLRYNGDSNASVIKVNSGGNFTLTDSQKDLPQNQKTPHEYYEDTKGLWVFVDDGYTPTAGQEIKTLYGGIITGGIGTFLSNHVCGGGVYVAGGTFNMTGGNISGNGGESKISVYSTYGGGVYVNYSGTFNMSGGSIIGNMATWDGGGVYVDGGTFDMSGGNISSNKASSGGGVYVDGGTFNVSGAPKITGNTGAGDKNNNVCLRSGIKITVTGALTDGAKIGVYNTGEVATGYTQSDKPSKYFIPDDSTKAVTKSGNEVIIGKAVATVESVNYAAIADAFSVANELTGSETNPVVITLLKDVETSTTLAVNSGKYIKLDLNGHMLKYTGDSGSVIGDSGSVIKVNSGGNFTLTDSQKDLPDKQKTPHKYYVSTDEFTEGIWVFVDDDDTSTEEQEIKTLYGGVITGGIGTNLYGNVCGGGVYVDGGTFNMTGGNISGNGGKIRIGNWICGGGV